jgi:hypothetical protein
MKRSRLLIISLCLLFSHPVFALRCGRALVDLGSYKEDVIDQCGEPESINTHIEIRGVSDRFGARIPSSPGTIKFGQQNWREIEVVVEEWIYDFGPRRFRQSLRFENGRLTDIKDLGRGRYH